MGKVGKMLRHSIRVRPLGLGLLAAVRRRTRTLLPKLSKTRAYPTWWGDKFPEYNYNLMYKFIAFQEGYGVVVPEMRTQPARPGQQSTIAF